MAIHCYTGVPGTGKTLHAVDDIEHVPQYANRNVYAHAVDEWARATPIACMHPGCRSCRKLDREVWKGMLKVEQWQEWVETGALLVIDECQYAFPQRREKETPQYIVRLTEHRHDGVDFILMTPNINLMDINVRRLVERHVHHLVAWNGKFQIVHNEAMEAEKDLKNGLRERWTWPTRSFGKYKSSDMHVKLSKPIPRIYYVLGASVVIAAVAFGGIAYQSQRMRRQGVSQEFLESQALKAESVRPAVVRNFTSEGTAQSARALYFSNPNNFSTRPRIAFLPESAPAYDSADLPEVEAPRLAACVRSAAKGCKCYSQIGTHYEIPEDACRVLVDGVPGDLQEYRGMIGRRDALQALQEGAGG